MWIEISLALGRWQVTVVQVAVTGLGWRLALGTGEDLEDGRWWMALPPGILAVQVQPWAGKLYLGIRVMGVWISRPQPPGARDGDESRRRLWIMR